MKIINIFSDLFINNGLVMSFLIVGIISMFSNFVSKKVTHGRIHNSAIAIFSGLILAYIGGKVMGGSKGLSDIPVFSGLAILGGSSLRDFSIVSTAYGAKFSEIKKCGPLGIAALFTGVISAFITGAIIAFSFGYTDAVSIATIASGAVTFIVGPVTGVALGADSAVVAISVAIGVIKSIAIMILTPFIAKRIGLKNAHGAMIYGALLGSTSGTAAGLAAIDPALVPYGAMAAVFYTGLGCLICPSVLYFIINLII